MTAGRAPSIRDASADHHAGGERWETAEAVAERILEKEVTRLGWRDNDDVKRSTGNPGKLAMVRRLRKETAMTLESIVQRLAMGSASMVSHCLRFG